MKFFKDHQAILQMLISCLMMSFTVATVRILSANYQTEFIIMMRNLFSSVMFLPYLLTTKSSGPEIKFNIKSLRIHFLRSAISVVSMTMWYHAISMISLYEAVSYTFTVPILTTLSAALIFGEYVGFRIYTSCLLGMIGVLVILRPGFREFSFAHLLLFGTIFLWMLTNLLIKHMTKTEKPLAIVAYMSFFMLIISAPLAINHLQSINLNGIFWIILLAIFSNIAQFLLASALSKSSISALQPFDFSRLVFISFIGHFFFDESIDPFVIIGASIIFLAILYSIPKRKKAQI